jgi:hypothetical protein
MEKNDAKIARKISLPFSNMGKKHHLSQTSLSNLVLKKLSELIARQIAT